MQTKGMTNNITGEANGAVEPTKGEGRGAYEGDVEEGNGAAGMEPMKEGGGPHHQHYEEAKTTGGAVEAGRYNAGEGG